ncbi:MAG: hypothetical protein JWP42_4955 [Pseudomonas sp.]|nr:hypothetical protein [Pseudomonas sp.]
MNELDGRDGCVYQALGDPDASEMRAKSECVMKIGMLLESGQLSTAEAAQKLGLPTDQLKDILRGKFRDLSVVKISDYLLRLQDDV